jgi:hypothetical protein
LKKIEVVSHNYGVKADDWLTYYEKSNYLETPRYEQTVEYCQRLDKASKWVKFTDFGISPQGRKLPLLIIDKDARFNPVNLDERKKAVILIEACIHAGESCGKDAGLTLLRDIIVDKKYGNVLDNVVILFIPIFNVDGHERFGPYNRINQIGPKEMGWRTTAQNLNLNRDFLKADAPEMKSWLKLFDVWLPDFLVDCHTTDGQDHQYAIAYAVANRQNMVAPVRAWLNEYYLPKIDSTMTKAGFPIVPYAGFKDSFNPDKGMMSWVAPPRFSHGYGAVQNRPFLLIEAHSLKTYKVRVDATYEMLLYTIKLIGSDSKRLLDVVQEGDFLTLVMIILSDIESLLVIP